MWCCKITIVRALHLNEMRIDHDESLKDVDLVLVFNENTRMGHYCAAGE